MVIRFLDHTPIAMNKQLEFAKSLNIGISDRRQMMHFYIENKNIPGAILAIIENRFIAAEKPFFNAYPKVLDALQRTSLDITPNSIPRSIIHELPAISIRFPVGGLHSKIAGTDWFIVSIFDGQPFEILKASGMHAFFSCKNKPFMAVYCMSDSVLRMSTVPLDQTFSEADFKAEDDKKDQTFFLCKIALGVMMLAADPDYIKPVVLKADEKKTTSLEDRVARAKKRGVFGFTIGEDIERSPHFRRPHFAIRWTGKGHAVPKLVPVKGAVIGKEIMTTVPTGFEE